MKKKAAFTSLLGLAVATSILAGSAAQAQMKTSVRKKATAKSSLKAKVQTAAHTKEEESRFSLNISETYYGNPDNNKNYIESYFSGGFTVAENVSLGLETGIESYMEDQPSNKAYDLEGSLSISGIEIAKDFTFTTGLMGVFPSSRGSRDKNMAGAYGIKGNFGLKIGGVSLSLDNNFYQVAYKSSPVPTPEADLFDGSEKRFYGNEYTRATTVLGLVVPIGPVKFKHDARYRQSTPYEGEETRTLRYRTRLSYGIVDSLSITGGAWWAQKVTDPKRAPFFDQKNRTLFVGLSLDV